jgi:hypothetical protein
MRAAGQAGDGLRAHPALEQLESRDLLSGFQPIAIEQVFLEQLNDARAAPAAYGAAIGVDLSYVAPSAPLAFNTELIQAARLHSQDMNARAYFSHVTPDGLNVGERMTQAGFFWTGWGESIAGGSAYPGPVDALRALITDAGVPGLGHRNQLLGIGGFQNQNQVGIGILQSGTGPLTNYYTIDTANSTGAGPFLTGVVFNDRDGDGRYAPGEGVGGVIITVTGAGSTTTFDSGGYAFPVAAGTYMVTASGPALPAPITRTVTVGAENVRLNFALGDPNTVARDYQTILGRSASAEEVASWLPVLDGPGGATVLATMIEESSEARMRLVRSWYAGYLGRQAGNGEQQGWVNALTNGASEEQVQAGILASDEFYNRSSVLVTAGTPDGRFVQSLYQLLLGRVAVNVDVSAWASAIRTIGRTKVALAFLRSPEYRRDQVGLYYAELLQRKSAPTPGEVDAWALSGLDLSEVRVALESSVEYLLWSFS